MSIVSTQCLRVRYEPWYIAMKSETNAKHLRRTSTKNLVTLENTIKKIKNIRKYNENGSLFLQTLFQYAGKSVVLKLKVLYFSFPTLPFPNSTVYDKIF